MTLTINDISYKPYFINKTGYYLEKYKANHNVKIGVDATFVIHLVNNGRLDAVKDQFKSYGPSKYVYILYNEGYKCRKKKQNIVDAATDLIDSYLYIFNFAKNNNLNNILILEDDFFFDPLILNPIHQRPIKYFLKNKMYDTFYLGCLPYFRKELDEYYSKVLISTGTHAVIYSKKLIDQTLNCIQAPLKVGDWDVYLKLFNQFMTNRPYCYQLFPETENQKQWGKNIGFKNSILKKQVVRKMIWLIRELHLDKTHEIGFPYYYTISKINYEKMIDTKKNMFNKYTQKITALKKIITILRDPV